VSTIIMSQAETQAYLNEDGAVVLRQVAPYGEDDNVIIIQVVHVDTLIAALQELKKESLS